MKFTTALALGAAPLAMAKAVHNVYPVRRDVSPMKRDGHSKGSSSSQGVSANSIQGVPIELQQLGLSGAGITTTQLQGADVVIIWINGGNGASTTQVNPQATVTVTQTVVGGGGAAATQPPGAVAPPAGTAPQPPTGTAPGIGATHTVTVGGVKGLQFEPTELKAAIGDMVIFTFLSQNHTATQSTFELPCDPLAGGMDSGFQPNANNSVNPPPQVAMQVMVDSPLWFYCRQANHCGKGMSFSINPTAEKTHAMFQAAAIAQKGNGVGSAITGNAPAGAAPPAAAPPAAAPASSAAPAAGASGTLAPLPAPGTPGTGATAGTGTLNQDGSCSCAVICGAGSFPAVQAQGIGSFGGMPGSLPASMLGM